MIKDSKPCWKCLAREQKYATPKEMLNDLLKGMTAGMVGRKLGVSISCVNQRAYFYGVKTRSKGSAGRVK